MPENLLPADSNQLPIVQLQAPLSTTEESEQVNTPQSEEEQQPVVSPEPAPASDDTSLEEDIEEELIIEDFTIDGICGVY